ncbi:MAG: hypothetical protein H7831_02345 [Magnetococcus sp. WYHC-3]
MSARLIRELLEKQHVIEQVVRNQSPRGRALVDTITHRQYLAEIQKLLGRLSPEDIAQLLGSLAMEDARLIWQQVEREREEEVLWELSDALRDHLVGQREPRFTQGRVTVCELSSGRMLFHNVTTRAEMLRIQPVWVDLLGVSRAERRWVGRHFGLELSDPEELTDLEVSARYYAEESDEIHLHSNFLLDREGESHSVPMAFIVSDGVLFTLRNEDLAVFRLQRLRLRRDGGAASDCMDLLLALYRADVEYSADALEDSYATLRRAGHSVLRKTLTDNDAARILLKIAREEDRNSRVRGNMLDTQRAVNFLVRGRFLTPPQAEEAREMLGDIESLNNHTEFLMEKINFLMDATVGFININQNRRVSWLTALGVVFMPINMLAGIGGMSEFSMMTQGIPWPWAYGGFVVGMILVGWVTYLLTFRLFESHPGRVHVHEDGGRGRRRRTPKGERVLG